MSPGRTSNEDGFTLVEVMVAMVVLLIGVLGTVTMIDGASAETSRTKAREGATALARTVLEISRGVPYEDLTSARVIQELDARDGFEDARVATPGHQVASRGYVYTVVPAVCTMDDPTDNLGLRDTGTSFCTNNDAPPSAATARDTNADDYRRMVVSLSWKSGSDPIDTMTQTGIVTNPVGGLGPSITSLLPDSPNVATVNATSPENPGITTATYDVVTSRVAAEVEWLVNGRRMGSAEGSDKTWDFAWNLGDADAPLFYDCTYVLQAVAIDDTGRAGAPKALTVQVNRRRPFAPLNLAGGLNLNDDVGTRRVDLQWDANRECDILSYKVYRSVGGGAFNTEVCSIPRGRPTECVDQNAPAASAGTLQYKVQATDTSSKVGDFSTVLAIYEGNANAPSAPGDFTVCTGGNPDCNDIDGNPAPSGTAVLSWTASTDPDGDEIAFYRVYRGGNSYDERVDILFPVTGKPLVYVDTDATGPNTYYVSAVDEHFGESVLSGPVVWGQ